MIIQFSLRHKDLTFFHSSTGRDFEPKVFPLRFLLLPPLLSIRPGICPHRDWDSLCQDGHYESWTERRMSGLTGGEDEGRTETCDASHDS